MDLLNELNTTLLQTSSEMKIWLFVSIALNVFLGLLFIKLVIDVDRLKHFFENNKKAKKVSESILDIGVFLALSLVIVYGVGTYLNFF